MTSKPFTRLKAGAERRQTDGERGSRWRVGDIRERERDIEREKERERERERKKGGRERAMYNIDEWRQKDKERSARRTWKIENSSPVDLGEHLSHNYRQGKGVGGGQGGVISKA